MIQYVCAKVLIDSQTNKMYGSLGIEPGCAQEYPQTQAAKKAQRVKYSERVGRLLVRIGEKLLQFAENNTMSQETMS